jgi:hypothetical protein
MENSVLWEITQCGRLISTDVSEEYTLYWIRIFITCFLLDSWFTDSSTLKMEMAYSSETSVCFQSTTRRYVPEEELLNLFDFSWLTLIDIKTDKRRSLGRYSSLEDWDHGVFLLVCWHQVEWRHNDSIFGISFVKGSDRMWAFVRNFLFPGRRMFDLRADHLRTYAASGVLLASCDTSPEVLLTSRCKPNTDWSTWDRVLEAEQAQSVMTVLRFPFRWRWCWRPRDYGTMLLSCR